jgi:LPXTG-motif cell wall-anchored protein
MKKSKWLIAVMVLCFIIGMAPLKELKVLAAGNSNTYNKIRVRVEGAKGTLFNKEFENTVNATTALDLLKVAVGADKVEGTSFITGILGEKPGISSAWMFYAESKNVLEVSSPVDKLNIKNSNGDFNYNEIVFYDGSYDSTLPTQLPIITVISNGDNHEISVTNSYTVGPIKNTEVTIQNIGIKVTDENGKINFTAPQGIYNIVFGKRSNYLEIVPVNYTVSLPIGVVEGSTKPSPNKIITDKKISVKSTIDLNKNYYSTVQNLKFGTILSLYQISDNVTLDMANIASKFKVSQLEKATSYAGNILALTALGKNPKNNDGMNYVQKLIDAQRTDGMFVVEDGDDMWPTTQAYSILALDMAGGNYKVEAAMKALVSMAKNGHYSDIDTTAMVITALANHKDVLGVNELIESSLKYIKDSQLYTGGFESYGAENPYSISTVIQALIANGIDVYSIEWTKNGNTMVDALFTYRFGDHFKYTASWGSDETMVSEQAFAALADVYRGKSIYQTLKLPVADEVKVATVDKVATKSELPETGSAIDFSVLMALGFIVSCTGAYIFRRKAKSI